MWQCIILAASHTPSLSSQPPAHEGSIIYHHHFHFPDVGTELHRDPAGWGTRQKGVAPGPMTNLHPNHLSLLRQSQVPPPHPHWNPQEREEGTFPPAGWWHGTSGIYYEDMGINTLVHRNKVAKDGQTLRGLKKKTGCGLPAWELTHLEHSLYWQMRPEFKPLI